MRRGSVQKRAVALLAGVSAAAAVGILPAAASTGGGSFVGPLKTVSQVASTVPGNGDVNPYGVAIVPESRGKLVEGDVLVSNFNNATPAPGGQQGRGTTLVEISPGGHRTLFAQIPANSVPGGVGLTTALAVLRSGWVIVGSLPTADGTSATMKPGELFVLDANGHVRKVITGHGINGPWDATALDFGSVADLFVTNVLTGITNGSPSTTTKGNVVRLTLAFGGGTPHVIASTVIANGISVKTDPAALIIGPTGVALGHDGTLFVADTVNSRIARIPDAVFRGRPFDAGANAATVSTDSHLNGPLGLVLAPNGDLLAANAGDNNLVELTQGGKFVTARNVDTVDAQGGALFGLAATAHPKAVYFVNDATNTLNVLR
jgi:hypothetical protein